ncbi:MAG: hypothetical protein ABSG98_11705 [Anaerolineales bacterium]|jgi:hypothetical protein
MESGKDWLRRATRNCEQESDGPRKYDQMKRIVEWVKRRGGEIKAGGSCSEGFVELASKRVPVEGNGQTDRVCVPRQLFAQAEREGWLGDLEKSAEICLDWLHLDDKK